MNRLWPDDEDLAGDEFRAAERQSVLLEVALLRWLLSAEGRDWCRWCLANRLARLQETADAVR